MAQVERRKAAVHPVALRALRIVLLALSAAGRANDAVAADALPAALSAAPEPAAVSDPAGSDAAPPRVIRHGYVRHRTVDQSIDESVHRLARSLDLDSDQQVRLRQILMEQHRQMMQLRGGGAPVSGNVTVTMLTIYDQTRGRIRAMLNQEQLKNYPAAVPRDQTVPAEADLQHWMQLQESNRKTVEGTPE